MTEHKHEWVIDNDYRWFKCEYGESPSTEDILRSLNATECLSAGKANKASGHIPLGELRNSLYEYARTLEGKDD